MNKTNVLNETLPYIKEKGRMLDYYLILNMFSIESYDENIVDELLKYRNDDFGFGNGLEPDLQSPSSSVLASNIAIEVLEQVSSPRKEKIINELAKYLVTQINVESKQFNFAPVDKDDYPHAVWWNGDVSSNFGYFNPTPEVAGFLFKNKEFLENLNIDELVDHIIERIVEELPNIDSEHSLFSIIKFSNGLNKERKEKLEKIINDKSKELICTEKNKWGEYVLEPYKIIDSKSHALYQEYKGSMNENMDYFLRTHTKEFVWIPEWKWGQFDDYFEEKAKFEWMGYVTYTKLKILKEFDIID